MIKGLREKIKSTLLYVTKKYLLLQAMPVDNTYKNDYMLPRNTCCCRPPPVHCQVSWIICYQEIPAVAGHRLRADHRCVIICYQKIPAVAGIGKIWEKMHFIICYQEIPAVAGSKSVHSFSIMIICY